MCVVIRCNYARFIALKNAFFGKLEQIMLDFALILR